MYEKEYITPSFKKRFVKIKRTTSSHWCCWYISHIYICVMNVWNTCPIIEDCISFGVTPWAFVSQGQCCFVFNWIFSQSLSNKGDQYVVTFSVRKAKVVYLLITVQTWRTVAVFTAPVCLFFSKTTFLEFSPSGKLILHWKMTRN